MSLWMIIGSTATYHWFPDFRKPLDIDILTPAEIKTSNSQICFVDAQWHEVAEELIKHSKDPVFADPDLLYTIKVSHAHWNVKWEKTMFDIEFLRRKDARLNHRLYNMLIPVWERVHGQKKVNMAQSMDTFFKDAVKREYDHEWLHELVAFYDAPLHERLRPDHGTAWCSQELFDNMSDDDQCKVALEEMMAVAIERSHLTEQSKQSEKLMAMSKAHFKLCTSMTKGWFARFLILNRYKLLSEYRSTWLPTMNKALSKLSKATQSH